jgi:hypothetical protein
MEMIIFKLSKTPQLQASRLKVVTIASITLSRALKAEGKIVVI